MSELLKNAWMGWQNYTDNGKLAALLFAALLFLWFAGKTDRQKPFFGYTAMIAVCCTVPFSAAGLMLYQTRFYDYVWIWSLVPLTAVTAWGFVEFLTDQRIGESRVQRAGIGLLAAAVLFLCGNLGKESVDFQAEKQELQGAEQVISAVSQNREGGEFCLLAPQSIMEYARVIDGKLLLPYGRNMWDHALDGYSYDVYLPETVDLYRWMCSLEELGDFDNALAIGMVTAEAYEPMRDACLKSADKHLDTALKKGVNCFLFPGGLKEEAVTYLAELLQEKTGSGVSAELITEAAGGSSYYLMMPERNRKG